jgi:hypothetical protein
MMEGFGKRAGTFFIVLGVFLVALFISSDAVKAPYYPLICSGAILLGLGWFLRVRNREPEEAKPSGRFRIFSGKPKTDKESKNKS